MLLNITDQSGDRLVQSDFCIRTLLEGPRELIFGGGRESLESRHAVAMTGVGSNHAHFQQLSLLFLCSSVYRNIT